ncbi:MAG: Two component system sensor histidine kinase MtrB [uncultured Nocardioidaceae bacterium]|uniref:Sensor histidine kinase MtrB n=1 Tax=uncultured Nocardioidaceae bacterium TaxID=253824 RepID=A0A6J4LVU5_9ACTN|nr:MAG: Two component system sensor histidine kinase MtrB [uncultured Nocardioidaceae bacterium]
MTAPSTTAPTRTGPLRRVTAAWRRSIQLRVVLSTVVLSALVVSLVGWALLRQITGGLVDDRVEVALEEAARSSSGVQESLTAATAEFDASTQLPALVSTIVSRAGAQGYEVVLVGPLPEAGGATSPASGERFTPGLDLRSVPTRLEAVVESPESSGSSWTFSTLSYDADTGRPPVPGVVVGTQLRLPADGGNYALYHLFPMSAERATIGLVQRALLTSGALLLVLVAALTWLVTRQVVTPVRWARRTAERLAAGRLEERMQVRGEDDLARLATSFNQMAAGLQTQIQALEDMSAAQRRFVSDVSHELRTPLTTVRMASDVLHDARDRFDPALARSAELLQHELDRFELLLTDLLEISRFDAGAAALHLEDVELGELARSVARSVQPLADRTGARIEVRAPAGGCFVEADPRRIERIIRNLVSNAVDHADSSDVVVRVSCNAEGSALTVRDHGVGLRPGDEVRVFNRFWRADPARARTSGGTGLGLSIALEDAHLHSGWLQAWGAPGGGAQFRLTLPRRAGERITVSPLPLVPEDAAREPVRA